MNKETNKPEEKLSWEGVEQYLATSVIEQSKRHSKMWFRAFLIMSIIAGLSLCGNIYQAYMANSYEYVIQDSDGQNNYNNDIDGDVDNVTGN